jgi:hypothetical protein
MAKWWNALRRAFSVSEETAPSRDRLDVKQVTALIEQVRALRSEEG